jgi:hypothetical protein
VVGEHEQVRKLPTTGQRGRPGSLPVRPIKACPRYCDDEESDVFILSGAKDLVPILDATAARKHVPLTVYGMSHQVSFNRPRIEWLFAPIAALDGGGHRNRPLPQEHAPIGAGPSRPAEPRSRSAQRLRRRAWVGR